MAKQGYEKMNADHCFTEESEGGKEDDGAGVQVRQVDLAMRDYGIEERR